MAYNFKSVLATYESVIIAYPTTGKTCHVKYLNAPSNWIKRCGQTKTLWKQAVCNTTILAKYSIFTVLSSNHRKSPREKQTHYNTKVVATFIRHCPTKKIN